MYTLETERLIIREPEYTDIDFWHALMSDKEIMYYLDDIMTSSYEEFEANLREAVTDITNPERTKYFFVLELKGSGITIGSAGYTVEKFTPGGKFAHMGYFLRKEFQGKGYMTEAVERIIKFAFEENGVFRLSTGCLKENGPSEKVMQKCGMIKEAELKSYVLHDGKIKDRVCYRLLKSEYEGISNYGHDFWAFLDKLIEDTEIIADRPKGSHHPRYESIVYPVSYGYLKGTTSMDGGGIDVWLGTNGCALDAVICTIDLFKKDSEIKLLLGCSEEEKDFIMDFHNNTESMRGVLIRRWR